MSWRTLPQSLGVDVLALKAAAFELSPDPAMVVDADGALVAVNEAAEALFGQGLGLLARGRFSAALPPGSALVSLLDRAIEEDAKVRERGVQITLFGLAPFEADGAAAPLGDGSVLLTLSVKAGLGVERGGGEATGGLRSIVGLGRMLAHEIKNPLAGIRGAAQLLKSGAKADDAPLAQLIVDETDRVRRLVDRMEAFSDDALPTLVPLNIHQVLDRVRALAANGVADGLTLREQYDPSLPPVLGDEDQLIQIFLNLVKNAAEAAHARGDGRGSIGIYTAYRHGVRVRAAKGQALRGAPLEIRIMDNGPGVPDHLREHLFQPFVTTKPNGVGLGLALVSKLVAAHGGLLDFESEPGRTVFRVLLPIADEEDAPA
ncbi:MAG TPA: ATP-binding protein [Phenylobacterium sp.]|jgi:two-component system nitrogen regulation sensor histidine kinase GlnL|uniref:two-component system sensor histidine kinase NtrB n=1 Tax=Phenylobacterium sp. TaxID=1871053 RepID=UPI002D4184AF|nr:ATP-binding protein [Phenylobacterium sp.]HZZ68984.1 ATP-binding protein [Phenylobacterium sp.]